VILGIGKRKIQMDLKINLFKKYRKELENEQL